MHGPMRPREMTLLVVEDDRISRDLLTRALKREGYAVLEAVDGMDALEVLGETSVDLVLLDITMPRLSGLEVLHAVRQRFGLLDLPVIMTSARSEVEDVVGALQLGANDYVTKPLNFPITMRRVAAVLSHRRTARALDESRRFLDLLVDNHGLSVSFHRADGTFQQASSALHTLLGRDDRSLSGVRLHDLLHPDDVVGLATHQGHLPDAYRLVARVLRDGGFAWCELTMDAVRDGVTGQISRVQVTWADLSTQLKSTPTATERSRGPVTGRSFAFTPAPPPQRIEATRLKYGPPVEVERTPIPLDRPTLPPVVVPGVPEERKAEILRLLDTP